MARRCARSGCAGDMSGRRAHAIYCCGPCRARASRDRRLEAAELAEPAEWFWSGCWAASADESAQKRTHPQTRPVGGDLGDRDR